MNAKKAKQARKLARAFINSEHGRAAGFVPQSQHIAKKRLDPATGRVISECRLGRCEKGIVQDVKRGLKRRQRDG